MIRLGAAKVTALRRAESRPGSAGVLRIRPRQQSGYSDRQRRGKTMGGRRRE
jgi:hypothetical protein